MTAFTPRSLIAGRVKATRRHELETALAAASVLLGTPQVACICSRVKNDVWYLCALAADLASHRDSSSPLAAALPGAPEHQGDGAYTVNLSEELQAVVVKQGDDLHSFVGTPTMVNRFILLEGFKEARPCTGSGLPWRLAPDTVTRRDARLQQGITWAGVLVSALACGVWLWAARHLPDQEAAQTAQHSEYSTATDAALRALAPPPYPPALAHLNKAVAQAIKDKGALVQFEHKEGRSSWTLNVNNQPVTGASN